MRNRRIRHKTLWLASSSNKSDTNCLKTVFCQKFGQLTVHFLDFFLYEVLLNTYIGNSQYCFFGPPCSLSVEIIWSCIVPIQDLNIKGYSWETHLSRYVTYRIYSTDSMHISNTAHLTWSFLVVFSEWIKKRDVYNVS